MSLYLDYGLRRKMYCKLTYVVAPAGLPAGLPAGANTNRVLAALGLGKFTTKYDLIS